MSSLNDPMYSFYKSGDGRQLNEPEFYALALIRNYFAELPEVLRGDSFRYARKRTGVVVSAAGRI